jgi:hypothetical protein
MAKKRVTPAKTKLRPRTTTRRHDIMSDDTYYPPEPAASKAVDTVTVKALKYHTAEGKAYQEGDTYTVDADKVDNLVAQGMAVVKE